MKGKIEVNGVNFSFEEIGKGETCLFLHGSRDRKEVFRFLVPFLKENFHLIFLDLRGHGETDVTKGGYSFEQFVDDITKFIEQKEIGEFNLLGHSLGGVLSVLLALRFPDKIRHLILMGTSAFFTPKFKRPGIGAVIDAKVIEETNRAAIPLFFLPKYKKMQKEILNNWSMLSPCVHQGLIRMGHPDLRAQIKKIEVPTLLIFGEQDKISTLENGKYLHQQINNSFLKTINDAGHFMFMERPREVAKEILSFLKKI